MNRSRILFPFAVLSLWVGVVGFAQDSAPVTGGRPQDGPPPRVSPPALPEGKSPVALFRELLAMNWQERQSFLTNRPPESQKLILAKLKEYETLPPAQCELRLRLTELRYYLLPLLSAPATNRIAQLARLPDELKSIIDLRLRNFDQLPPEKQKEVIETARIMPLVAESATGSGTNTAPLSLALQESISQWQQLPAGKRAAMASRFEQYFGLNAGERQETLSTLSPQERAQIQKTLQTFDRLEPQKRAQCIRALNKICNLSPAERRSFLKSAETWQSMSPEQRKAWRTLVMNASQGPPLPPGMSSPPIPPRLPAMPSLGRGQAMNTN